jgi:hypothetical protein
MEVVPTPVANANVVGEKREEGGVADVQQLEEKREHAREEHHRRSRKRRF